MKKINLLSALFIIVSTFYTLAYANVIGKPEFQWPFSTHDFGKIKKGIPVTVAFKFTNIGKESLMISEAKAGCECTTANFTREPIAPGKNGQILITYNAATSGKFSKIVSVTSNASDLPQELTISGEVIE